MSLSFHDPRGRARVAPAPYTARLSLDGSPVIGLLANGFPDSGPFLDALEGVLSRALPAARFVRYAKPNASTPADEPLLARIVAECAALVTAYGH